MRGHKGRWKRNYKTHFHIDSIIMFLNQFREVGWLSYYLDAFNNSPKR